MKRQWEVSDKVEFSSPERDTHQKICIHVYSTGCKKIKYTIKLFKKYKVVNE